MGVALGQMANTALEDKIGHRFARSDLLEEALTHRSVGHGQSPRRRGKAGSASYERLEFLGDRVLGLVVAEMLLERFPRESEGDLARRHADLVRKETLAQVALDLEIPAFVRLPLVEEPAARSNPALLADVCEAVIAALYLDAGFDEARRFVKKHWQGRMDAAVAPPKDAKTALQEWAQARSLKLPTYRLVRSDGPPHQPIFTVSVHVMGYDAVEASGPSKRLAEVVAATALLDQLKKAEIG